MNEKTMLLHHFLAGLAYRTQKAIRNAPESYFSYRASPGVRTPLELIQHIESVLGYARTFFIGGVYDPVPLPSVREEIVRLHATIEELASLIEAGTPIREISEEQLLHGPFSDAMTHVGQLAILRRLAGSPVPPENFIYAEITTKNLGPDQAEPARPGDRHFVWNPGEGIQVAAPTVRVQCIARVHQLEEIRAESLRAHHLERLMSVYAEDVEEVHPGALRVVGKEAVKNFYDELISRLPHFESDSEVSSVTIAECASLVVVEGQYQSTADRNDPASFGEGRFQRIWRLENGDWRLWRSISFIAESIARTD